MGDTKTQVLRPRLRWGGFAVCDLLRSRRTCSAGVQAHTFVAAPQQQHDGGVQRCSCHTSIHRLLC